MPHLAIVKQCQNGQEESGIFLAGGDARAVSADLLSIVQKSLPFMELVESEDPEFEVAIKYPKGSANTMADYGSQLTKLWSGFKQGRGHGLCNNSGMAVLDMMETHGYTLLNLQHQGADQFSPHVHRGCLQKSVNARSLRLY
jgi:hypothetical protein